MLRYFFRQFTLASGVVAIGIGTSSLLSATDDPPEPTIQPANPTAPSTDISAATQANSTPEKLPPPAAAQYVGTNQCFICHRPQTNTWSETKHAHAFTDVPQKYQSDSDCLKCHVTGFGERGGYVAGTEKDLLMVGCEACHGPGAGHVDAANRFVLATPAEEAKIEKEMRDSIVKTPTDSVCIACHRTQAHQNHPAYEGQPSPPVASGSVVQCYPVAQRSPSTTATVSYHSGFNVKTCGSCHYGEYKQWRTEKHSGLSAILPVKYSSDQDCQKCHPMSDVVAKSSIAGAAPHHNQIGLVCESCHGPALEHVRFNRHFISRQPLGPELEQQSRHLIRDSKPSTTCVQCHLRESHKQHPQFEGQQSGRAL